MLSATLTEALREIERYQTDESIAPVYEKHKALIEKVKTVMQGVRLIYDIVPAVGDAPSEVKQWNEAKIAKIVNALQGLDVSAVQAAIDFDPSFAPGG